MRDVTVHQSVSAPQVCAGDALRITLSNLHQAAPSAQDVSLLLIYNVNQELNLQPGEKGLPLDFSNPDNQVLATAPISTDGQAVLEVTLQDAYGPDPQGRQLLLRPGGSNALLYLKLEGSYTALQTQLCPAEGA